MKNNRETVYRMKLTGYELRAMIAILNDMRLQMKAKREDTGRINDLILRFIDSQPA